MDVLAKVFSVVLFKRYSSLKEAKINVKGTDPLDWSAYENTMTILKKRYSLESKTSLGEGNTCISLFTRHTGIHVHFHAT